MLSIVVLIDYLALPILLIFIGFMVYSKYLDRLFDYLVLLVLAGAASEGIKYIVDKPRPESSLMFEGSSFPSTHTTIAYAAVFFYVLVRHSFKNGVGKAKIEMGEWVAIFVMFLLALLVGFLRITLGAHYLVDVLAGISLGFLISLPFMYYDLSIRRIK